MPGNQEEYVDNPPYFQSDWELYKTDKNNSKNCSLKLKVVQYPKHIDKNESDKVSFNRVDSRKLSCLKGPTSQSWQPMSSQNKRYDYLILFINLTEIKIPNHRCAL